MLVPTERAKLVTYTGVNPRRYITVHQTGNTSRGANANMHARLQYNGNPREASWHEQVDDKECIQSFAHTAKCWHGGDGWTGAGNNESIAIEICVNSDGDYTRAVRNGARRVTQLMKMYNIPISRVVQHNHWSGKACPAQIRAGKNGINWSAFLKIVQEELDGPKDGATVTQKKPLELARDWQTYLRSQGFYPEPYRIDGVWGPLSVTEMQKWLRSLGYYGTGLKIDGIEGEYTIMALQEFLRDKAGYTGLIGGAEGALTLEAQRRFLDSVKTPAPAPAPAPAPEPTADMLKHVTREIEALEKRLHETIAQAVADGIASVTPEVPPFKITVTPVNKEV